MSTIIQIGSKVRRLSGEFGGMRRGDVGTVVDVTVKGVVLEEFGGFHDPRWLEHHSPAFVSQAPEPYPAINAEIKDAMTVTGTVTGRKDDSGKLDFTLLDDMPRALAAVVEVMQWAITKKEPVPYVRGSWLGVSADRYRAAILRHRNAGAYQASKDGEPAARFQRDVETKLLHQAHEACSALMALENTIREMEAQDGV